MDACAWRLTIVSPLMRRRITTLRVNKYHEDWLLRNVEIENQFLILKRPVLADVHLYPIQRNLMYIFLDQVLPNHKVALLTSLLTLVFQ
jgi:hypothetical protein